MKLRHSCGNCRFFEARGERGDLGLCCRHAPRPRGDEQFYRKNGASWLYVPKMGWCGEWRRAGLFYRGVLRWLYNRWAKNIDGAWRLDAPKELEQIARFQQVIDAEAELRRVEALYQRKRRAVGPWVMFRRPGLLLKRRQP
jgi:hypothetical protein